MRTAAVALSIRQPWAWLIVRPDLQGEVRQRAVAAGEIKDMENRNWRTPRRERVAIHAAQAMTVEEYLGAQLFVARRFPRIVLPIPADLEKGGIVGEVDVDGSSAVSQSLWFTGPWGFHLRNATPLPFEPLRGALGFFKLPALKP